MTIGEAGAPTPHERAGTVFERLRTHAFHPLQPDRRTFTMDRYLGVPGVADLDDRDGRVRTTAVRDLVGLALHEPAAVIAGLSDANGHVRCMAALALGVAGATAARAALEAVLTTDPEPIVRTYAAIALGETGSSAALPVLNKRSSEEDDEDVGHQLELALAQIASGRHGSEAQRQAFLGIRDEDAGRVRAGEPAPGFSLDDTDGRTWNVRDGLGRWQVLIWVFADWCPVCHREFHELIALRDAFARHEVRVATIEAHDTWRGRLMVGREIQPALWGSRDWFRETYTERIWWPHLLDRGGAVGWRYGTDPMAFAVHGEFVNRPTTVIIDPGGVVRLAYAGTFWGDRPSIDQTLDMVRTQDFTFVHPDRLDAPA